MPDIFADTAGWGHLVDATQAYHHRAATIYRGARQQGSICITTNYILTELVALLRNPLRIPHTQIVAFITGLKASPYVNIVHVDPTLDAQAWQLFVERPDKEWSLVDRVCFVVMQQYGLYEAFTTDHHFEQAGFVCLLKA
jgi:predicted nucleic acid-binding protein